MRVRYGILLLLVNLPLAYGLFELLRDAKATPQQKAEAIVVALFVLGLMVVIWWFAERIDAAIRQGNRDHAIGLRRCPHCGYDCRATSTQACPECGGSTA